MMAWAAIGIVAVGSYLLRWGGINVASRNPSPAWDRALGHLASAALGAIVASSALTGEAVATGRLTADHVALAAALIVVRRTGNLVHAVVVGMPIVWLGAAFW
jgi:branched-subunit amino acid transport protein